MIVGEKIFAFIRRTTSKTYILRKHNFIVISVFHDDLKNKFIFLKRNIF